MYIYPSHVYAIKCLYVFTICSKISQPLLIGFFEIKRNYLLFSLNVYFPKKRKRKKKTIYLSFCNIIPFYHRFSEILYREILFSLSFG